MSSAPFSSLLAEHAQLMLGPRTAADRKRLALLDDYLRACSGREQWYGTQQGPIAVPDELDLRRLAMGVEPGDKLSRPLEPHHVDATPVHADLRVITEDDPLFQQSIELRYAVLRAPLGVARADFKPDAGPGWIYVAAIDAGRVVGTVALDPTNRLRQMAVAPECAGLGRALVRKLESVAPSPAISLNARAHVIGFYSRLGYRCTGDVFNEVGIPHVRMDKK